MNKETKRLEKVCELLGVEVGDLPAFSKKETDLILLAITIGLKKNYISKEELREKIENIKQTDEWVDSGENKLLRRQHQIGYNKALQTLLKELNL